MIRICCRRINSMRFPVYSVKAFSSSVGPQDLDHTSLLHKFTPIYKFPYIKEISLINRLKLYQSLLTAIAIPGVISLHQSDFVSLEAAYITIAIGLCGCASFYLFGSIANKFIGFVYLHKDEDSVRLAYLDFWGKRQDITIPANDIIPISETPSSITDALYLKLSRFSVEDKLKINVKFGNVLDDEKFNKVFKLID